MQDIRLLIVDDGNNGSSLMEICTKKHLKKFFFEIKLACSLQEAIDAVVTTNYSLIFLDINLNGNSGFDLLPFLSEETKVVFITDYAEHTIKAIKSKASDYILKPINPVDIKKYLNSFQKRNDQTRKTAKCILVKDHGESIPVPLSTIEYIEANGAYSIINLFNNKNYTIAKTLKALSPQVCNDFLRIHRSYFVNVKAIKSFNREELTTISLKCISVSKLGYKNLLKFF